VEPTIRSSEEPEEAIIPGSGPRRRYRLGLRTRLLGSFLLLSLLPLFGSNAVGYLRSRRIVETQVEGFLRQISDLQAAHVAEHVREQLAFLGAIASGNRFLQAAAERHIPDANPLMRSAATPQAVTDYLERQVVDSEHQFTGMALFALDGTLLGASPGLPQPYRRGGPASDALAVIRTPPPTKPPTLRYTVPVTSQDGDVVAYLAATIHSSQTGAFLDAPMHLVGDVEWFILDAAGRPIFISHAHRTLSYSDPLETPLAKLPPGSEGHYTNGEGVEVIATSIAMPDYPWMFLAEIPATVALGELRSLRSLSIVSGLVFALLVLAAGWLLASGVVSPVETLVVATRRLAGGDLATRVPPGRHDEIGELSSAFNEMARDLTAREEEIRDFHEREIARADQLATVGELAAGLAHEIKNPVVGIANGLDLVRRHIGQSEELDTVAEEMARQLHRIERAVRDLLAFARPRSPERTAVDLDSAVRQALVLVEPAAVKSGVSVQLQPNPTLSTVDADGEQIQQAIVNLVMNAVQHSKRGDTVRITSRAVGDRVELSIEDTGTGIDEETMTQLFKPFFTTRHAGTGLGLSISRGIVERHGGRLTVQSEVGKGSTFTIVLPASSTAGTDPASGEKP
jgi:signal transduction histidine kinase